MRLCKALLLVALVLGSTTSGRSAELPLVRVVTVPIEGAADVYYAADHGFFRDAGLDVQIDTIAAGQNIVVAVAGGSYDAGISTTIAIALARQRGVPIRIISGATMHVSSATTDLLMVAQGSPYRTARDLNGKTVAVTGLGNVPYLATQLWLGKNGASVSSIKFVELPYPAMPAALETGRVDAAMMAEPYITTSKNFARVLANAYDAIAPRFLLGGWFSSDAWIQQHPDAARRFAEAMRKAHEWGATHPAETGAILVAHTRIPPESVGQMVRATFASTADPKLLQPVLDAALAAGMLPRPVVAGDLIWTP
jgi:NitT/TauT family transport system substrate-binding protein